MERAQSSSCVFGTSVLAFLENSSINTFESAASQAGRGQVLWWYFKQPCLTQGPRIPCTTSPQVLYILALMAVLRGNVRAGRGIRETACL